MAPPTWTVTASMAECHDYWTTTRLADGRVLVAGGGADSNAQLAAELFDPSTGRWTATGSTTSAGEGHTATLLPDGQVLVVGGYRDDWLVTAELYDPGTGKWSATGSTATARGGHSATLLPDGKVLVVGGYNGPGGDFYATSSAAELYDPGSGKWSPTGSLATARGGHTATLLPDGKVLVAGGDASLGSGGGPMLASAELYDPGSGRWTATGSMAEARGAFAATRLPDGRVLVVGGRYAAVAIDGLASAELYDPISGQWTATGSMAQARQNGQTATLLLDGTVLVVGGDDTRSAELYDPSGRRWTATASMLAASGGRATLLPDGRVLVVGRACGQEELEGPAYAEIFDPKGGFSDVEANLLPACARREVRLCAASG